ncbi:MAG: glycosyltransferase [Methylococcaceae bacterium]
MKNITKLFASDHLLYEKPWLIVGKGPSFELINDIDLSAYNVLALNHVISQTSAKISHLIDIDVFEDCAEDIYAQAEYLVIPYYPHSDNQPGKLSLPQLVNKLPLLGKMNQEGRLFWYDHLGINALLRHGKMPVRLNRQIRVTYFSAEAAIDILATQGIKSIRTLGVDGGSSYSRIFDQTCPYTRLSNGNISFDSQFSNIIKKITTFNIDFQALGKNDYPIKVYIATQEEQMLAVKVLEYSIRKHSSQPVEIYPLHQTNIHYREPKDPRNKQRTPFSFQRFLIPQLNACRGRAIYLDSDMQLFRDINQLWNLPMGSHDILTVIPHRSEKRRLQFSVMLMDCEKLAWDIDAIIDDLDAGHLSYESLMYDMAVAKNIGVSIPSEWNCLEWFKENKSLLLHYTDMPTQPWVSRKNKRGHLWMNDLIEAIDSGFIDINYVKKHIERGWVRPSLIYQIENKVLSSLNLPESICQLDENFIAPYKNL